ncbi:MAG: hypothetical protein ACAH83_11930 [Alphaproteobacteria bacterium]
MPDDWMRKYLVIADKAPPAAAAERSVKEEPPAIAIPATQEPPPAAEIKPEKLVRKRSLKSAFNEAAAQLASEEDKPKKKAPRKRSVKKEFDDAAEKKPKKAAPKRKPVRKAKI